MTLASRYKALIASGFTPFPTRVNACSGDQLLKKKFFFIDTGAIDEGIVDMILLGANLPKVYLHERRDGAYDIVFGEEIVETIKAVLSDKRFALENQFLNRFSDVCVDIVTFDWKMERHDVMYFVNKVLKRERHDD